MFSYLKIIKQNLKSSVLRTLYATILCSLGVVTSSYIYLRTSLKKELEEKLQKIESDFTSKINFYKLLVINTTHKIESESLYRKPDQLHKLLQYTYKSLRDFDYKDKTIALRWMSSDPYNYQIDQLGVKKGTKISQTTIPSNLKNDDIYTKLNYEWDSLNKICSYQMCSAVVSKLGVNTGIICLDERLQDVLRTPNDSIFNTYFSNDEARNNLILPYRNLSHIKQIKDLKLLSDKFTIVGEVPSSSFYYLFLKLIVYPLAMIWILAILYFFIIINLRKKILFQTDVIEKYLNASENTHESINKFRDKLERRLCLVLQLVTGIQYSEKELEEVKDSIVNLGGDLNICGLFGKKVLVEQLNSDIDNIISIFRKTIINKSITIQYQVDSTLKFISIDTLNFQIILGSLIHNSIKSLQMRGKLFIEIKFIAARSKDLLKIILTDNSFGKFDQNFENMDYFLFPSIDYIRAKIIEQNGTIILSNELYEGKSIQLTLPIDKTGAENNVVNLF